MRVGDVHVCFYIYSYAHLICLIALFGNLWFGLVSWAPQSSSADMGVQFDRHGLVVATGSEQPDREPLTHAQCPSLAFVPTLTLTLNPAP